MLMKQPFVKKKNVPSSHTPISPARWSHNITWKIQGNRPQLCAFYIINTSRSLIADAEKSSGRGRGEGAHRSHKAQEAWQSAAGFGPPLGAGFILRRTSDPLQDGDSAPLPRHPSNDARHHRRTLGRRSLYAITGGHDVQVSRCRSADRPISSGTATTEETDQSTLVLLTSVSFDWPPSLCWPPMMLYSVSTTVLGPPLARATSSTLGERFAHSRVQSLVCVSAADELLLLENGAYRCQGLLAICFHSKVVAGLKCVGKAVLTFGGHRPSGGPSLETQLALGHKAPAPDVFRLWGGIVHYPFEGCL